MLRTQNFVRNDASRKSLSTDQKFIYKFQRKKILINRGS